MPTRPPITGGGPETRGHGAHANNRGRGKIGLDRAPPGRLDFEIESARSGVDQIVERIVACSFAGALGAHRLGTRSRSRARRLGFAFGPAFGLVRQWGLIRNLSSAHPRPLFRGG